MLILRMTAVGLVCLAAACSGAATREAVPASAAPTAAVTRVDAPSAAPLPGSMPAEFAPGPDDSQAAPVTAAAASPFAEPVAAPPVAPARKPAPPKPPRLPAKPIVQPVPAKRLMPASPPGVAPKANATATPGKLAGRLDLVSGARQKVAAGEVSEAVVYFLPKAGAARPRPGRFSVDTHSKGFQPALLVVPVGSTVAFPNRDEILHNVYSTTPGASFNLGTYGPGQNRETRFSRAGLVLVNCNVHHGMKANVLVMETPYFTRPGRDGRFELKNLPAGPGTLVFWHPRAAAVSKPVTGVGATAVAVRLIAVRPRVGTH